VHARQEEEVHEDLMHLVFFRTTRDGSSSGGMYESKDESEEEEGRRGRRRRRKGRRGMTGRWTRGGGSH
jgi:hypothetical protein